MKEETSKSITGRIQSKREYSKRIFLTIVFQDDTNSTTLQVICEEDKLQHVKLWAPLLHEHVVCTFFGTMGVSSTNQVSLFANKIELQKLHFDPAYLQRILHALQAGIVLQVEQVQVIFPHLQDVLQVQNDKQELKRALQVVSKLLQGKPANFSRTGKPKMTIGQQHMLQAIRAKCTCCCDICHEELQQVATTTTTTIVDINEDFGMEQERRMAYLEKKKQPQVLWMLQQLQQFKFTHICDVGGGRGDLAIAIALHFPHAHVTVIDINEQSLQVGKQRAKDLPNICFLCADATTFVPQTKVDVFVGLHACGGLSDCILELALKLQAGFVICTCCFGKNMNMYQWQQDTNITTEEQLLLCQRAEIHDDMETAKTCMHIINSYRLARVSKLKAIDMDIQLKTFDPSYSPKNFVLFGKIKS